MFADLNKHAVRPSDSLGTLYDQRDPSSELARYIYNDVECFKKLTDLEHSSLSKRSSKLFTLSSLKLASRSLLKKGPKDQISDSDMQLASQYWSTVCENMPDWISALNKNVSTADLREQQIHAHGIALHALGSAGADLMEQQPDNWKNSISSLQNIDWTRSNTKLWQGRCTDIRGKLSKTNLSITLTANVIRKHYGLKLSETDQETENQFNS